jgi:peroxiredoxin
MASRKQDKDARRAERLAAQATLQAAERHRRVRNIALSALVIALAVAGLSVALRAGRGSSAASGAGAGSTQQQLVIDEPAPAFRARDVVSGRVVTLSTFAGHKTLLFFSEGASCQACLLQAGDLQNSAAMRKAGIWLVSITTDPAGLLHQAAAAYQLSTPVLADTSQAMSSAYGMLAQGGMQHPGEDGHAFVLLDQHGKAIWKRAYPQMYVPPAQLLSDMGAAA